MDHIDGHLLNHGYIQTRSLCQESRAPLQPFLMAGFNTSFAELVGAHPVDAAHHDVAEYDGVGGAADQFEIQLEAGILLKAGHVGADHRDLFHAGLFEGAADETDIVGSAAASACLCHDDGSAVQVVFAGLKCLHDLSHYEE